MNIWFDAIARAGGIEAASSHPVSHARPATVRRNRAAPVPHGASPRTS